MSQKGHLTPPVPGIPLLVEGNVLSESETDWSESDTAGSESEAVGFKSEAVGFKSGTKGPDPGIAEWESGTEWESGRRGAPETKDF